MQIYLRTIAESLQNTKPDELNTGKHIGAGKPLRQDEFRLE